MHVSRSHDIYQYSQVLEVQDWKWKAAGDVSNANLLTGAKTVFVVQHTPENSSSTKTLGSKIIWWLENSNLP